MIERRGSSNKIKYYSEAFSIQLYLFTVRNKGRDPGHKSHFRFGNVRKDSYEALYDTYRRTYLHFEIERKRKKKNSLSFVEKYVGY